MICCSIDVPSSSGPAEQGIASMKGEAGAGNLAALGGAYHGHRTAIQQVQQDLTSIQHPPSTMTKLEEMEDV